MMRQWLTSLVVLALLAGLVLGQSDGFQRERNDRTGAQKDALEGKAPPALEVANWTNSPPTDLASLRGKVVVLDFWGTW